MRLRSFPLYDYATHYWGQHARKSPAGSACPEIMSFLASRLKVEAASQAMLAAKSKWQRWGKHGQYSEEVPRDILGLHLVAMLGLVDAVRALLKAGTKPYVRDNGARTPLHWAAKNGHEAVVEQLLATDGVSPDDTDEDGYTPLIMAAQSGADGVLLLLLATGKVDVDARDLFKRSALHYAAEHGHETTAALLLTTGNAKADLKDSVDQTPLFLAAQKGYEDVVGLILSSGPVEV